MGRAMPRAPAWAAPRPVHPPVSRLTGTGRIQLDEVEADMMERHPPVRVACSVTLRHSGEHDQHWRLFTTVARTATPRRPVQGFLQPRFGRRTVHR